jgi:O-antigen/teichoic acid export membrane protein
MIAALVPLALVSPWVIEHMVGTAYAPADEVIWLLVPGMVALGVWRVVAYYLAAFGNAATRTSSASVGTAVMLTTIAILTPRYGLQGAAIGASAGWISMLGAIPLSLRWGAK